MEITLRTRKLERVFNSQAKLQKEYGARTAKAIKTRVAVLAVASNLALVPVTPPERRYQLKGRRKNQFAVHLPEGMRLVLEVGNDPVPRCADMGIDLHQITKISIREVANYH